MAKYAEDEIPVCVKCDSKDERRLCLKCGMTFCAHFASPTDLRFCHNCLQDFSLQETIMEKLVERTDSNGRITSAKKFHARHIKMLGNDWLFAATLIENMTDSEVEATIEYHRANVSIMLMEREQRKLERYKKLASIVVPRIKHETQEEKEKREAKAAEKSNKKNKIKEIKPTDVDSILKLMKTLIDSGLTKEQVLGMLEK